MLAFEPAGSALRVSALGRRYEGKAYRDLPVHDIRVARTYGVARGLRKVEIVAAVLDEKGDVINDQGTTPSSRVRTRAC